MAVEVGPGAVAGLVEVAPVGLAPLAVLVQVVLQAERVQVDFAQEVLGHLVAVPLELGAVVVGSAAVGAVAAAAAAVECP